MNFLPPGGLTDEEVAALLASVNRLESEAAAARLRAEAADLLAAQLRVRAEYAEALARKHIELGRSPRDILFSIGPFVTDFLDKYRDRFSEAEAEPLRDLVGPLKAMQDIQAAVETQEREAGRGPYLPGQQ